MAAEIDTLIEALRRLLRKGPEALHGPTGAFLTALRFPPAGADSNTHALGEAARYAERIHQMLLADPDHPDWQQIADAYAAWNDRIAANDDPLAAIKDFAAAFCN